MRLGPIKNEWPFAAMLVMSLWLGTAIAAGFDAWSDADEDTPALLLDTCKSALVLAGVMVIFGRVTRLRLFGKCAEAAAGDASNTLK